MTTTTGLSQELVVLARIVDLVCWREDEQKVGGGGYSASRTAIDVLADNGILTNLDSDWARTVRADWAREDWRSKHGHVGDSVDSAVIDAIELMADQFIGRDGGYALPGKSAEGDRVWTAAIDLLQDVGLAQWNP